jgi:hypothetical protein
MTDDPRPGWAVRLQEAREARGWSKFEMARRLYRAAGLSVPNTDKLKSLVRQIYGWEGGEHFPRDWASAYATAYDMAEEQLFGSAESAKPTVIRPVGTLTATNRIAEWMSSMERRNLLTLMGLGVAAPWPVAENLRAALTRTAGASDSVADWRETVSDYASMMSVTPAATILPDLLTDLNEVNSLLETGHPEQQPLLEVAAALATFTSMATYDSGYPSRAFRWWRTAQRLADRSGYAPIRAYVRSRRGADMLYGHNQTDQALQLANEAVSITESRPSIGLAEAHALRAGALAVGGNPEARSSFDDMARTADKLPPRREIFESAVWRTSDTRIHQTQTWMLVRLRDGAAAVRAGRMDPNPWTQMGVAAGMVLAGKVDDGVGHAVETLRGLDPAQDRLSIRNKGRDVLAVLPDWARASTTARELRALTQGSAA